MLKSRGFHKDINNFLLFCKRFFLRKALCDLHQHAVGWCNVVCIARLNLQLKNYFHSIHILTFCVLKSNIQSHLIFYYKLILTLLSSSTGNTHKSWTSQSKNKTLKLNYHFKHVYEKLVLTLYRRRWRETHLALADRYILFEFVWAYRELYHSFSRACCTRTTPRISSLDQQRSFARFLFHFPTSMVHIT